MLRPKQQQTVKPSDRLDQLDAERFGDMIVSLPFALYEARLLGVLKRAQADCETAPEPRDIHRAQGAVQALRVALSLPAKMLAEIKEKAAP